MTSIIIRNTILRIFKFTSKADVVFCVNPFIKGVIYFPNTQDTYDYFYSYSGQRLRKHEGKHLEQLEKYGTIKFIWLVIYYCIRYGYKNSPLEIEAREAENIY